MYDYFCQYLLFLPSILTTYGRGHDMLGKEVFVSYCYDNISWGGLVSGVQKIEIIQGPVPWAHQCLDPGSQSVAESMTDCLSGSSHLEYLVIVVIFNTSSLLSCVYGSMPVNPVFLRISVFNLFCDPRLFSVAFKIPCVFSR